MAEIADTVKTINKTLFTVRFLHAGYGFPRPGNILDNISFQPDDDTQKILTNYNIGFRFLNDTLVVFMRCSNLIPTTPMVKFSGDIRLRFFMQVSTDFLKRTEVQPVGASQLYQFSNKVNIATDRFLSMHTEGVNNDDLKPVSVAEPGETCFGVIDVFNAGAINNTYDLFSGADQTLNSPGYSIRFISKI